MINTIHNQNASIGLLNGTFLQQPVQRNEPQDTTAAPAADVVHIQKPDLMTDAEADEAMAMVQNSLQQSAGEALAVHGGLDFDRVMALLAEV